MFFEIDWALKPEINIHNLQKKKKTPCLMGAKYFIKNKLKKERLSLLLCQREVDYFYMGLQINFYFYAFFV